MIDAFHQMFIGLSAIFSAPTNCLPRPRMVITLPPVSATQAIAYDFSHISGDFNRSMDKVKNAKQLEMNLTSERSST
jgi:hypothetical protein